MPWKTREKIKKNPEKQAETSRTHAIPLVFFIIFCYNIRNNRGIPLFG